jgi:MFS family permease
MKHLPIFLVTFLDFLAFSAVVPFFPLLFLDTSHSLFSPTYPMEIRYILMGLLLATYPLAQVLAAPILGHASDKIGRKGVLVLSYLGNSAGYLLCAVGALTGSLPWFFAGNFIAGLSGVNISTVNAIIADESEKISRAKLFGFFNMMLGLGFTLGPYFSSLWLSKEGGIAGIFIICAFLSLINLGVIYFNLPQNSGPTALLKLKWREIFACSKENRVLLGAIFLFSFGWYFFIKTYQVFLVEQVRCSDIEIFRVISCYGLFSLITQGFFIGWLHKHIRTSRLMEALLIALALSLFSLLFAKTFISVLAVTALFSFAYSSLMPTVVDTVAESAPERGRGQMMGLYQSVLAISKVTAPAIAGLSMAMTPLTSPLISSFFILSSVAMLVIYRRRLVPA